MFCKRTMVSAATRKAPHCFNFLRQVTVLNRARCGMVANQLEVAECVNDWGTATSLCNKAH